MILIDINVWLSIFADVTSRVWFHRLFVLGIILKWRSAVLVIMAIH